MSDEPKTMLVPELTSGNSLLGRIVDASMLLAIISAFLFVCGDAYLEGFYGYFGIAPLSLDYPFDHYLLCSLVTLGQLSVWESAFAFVFVVLSTVISIRLRTQFLIKIRAVFADFDRWSKYLIITAAFLIAFLLTVLIAYHLGKYQAPSIFGDGIWVQLRFKVGNGAPYDSCLIKANKAGSLRLLAQTKDQVVVLEKPESQPDRKAKSVFVVSCKDLSSVHLLYVAGQPIP